MSLPSTIRRSIKINIFPKHFNKKKKFNPQKHHKNQMTYNFGIWLFLLPRKWKQFNFNQRIWIFFVVRILNNVILPCKQSTMGGFTVTLILIKKNILECFFFSFWNNEKFQITFSTPVRSFSKSSNELIEMPDFLCQFMPYRDAAILDAAVVLAEYIEKLCSESRKKKKFIRI